MSATEPQENEKKFYPKEVLVEGCINSKAKEVISQMLERRLAELDPAGIQAKFVIKLQNEINELADCADMLEEETKESETDESSESE